MKSSFPTFAAILMLTSLSTAPFSFAQDDAVVTLSPGDHSKLYPTLAGLCVAQVNVGETLLAIGSPYIPSRTILELAIHCDVERNSRGRRRVTLRPIILRTIESRGQTARLQTQLKSARLTQA